MSKSKLKRLIPFLILTLLGIGIYFNSLNNDFSVIDDLQAFVNNETVKDLPENFRSLRIRKIIHSLSYNIFGVNPVPLHISSLFLHILVTWLGFLFVKQLYNSKVASLTSLLFVTHPVNTETICWISADPYLYKAIFSLIIFILYSSYKKKRQKKYLIWSIIVFSIGLLTLRTVWLLTISLALLVIDQLIIEQKINLQSAVKLGWFLIPTTIFLSLIFIKSYQRRVSYRDVPSYYNQQSLQPLIRSAPYTLATMLKLYSFPKNLTVYYDGNPISSQEYQIMLAVSIGYLSLIFYYWNKNKQITGLLVILPVLIAPTFSPKKVTWYMAERYLYLGTIFFTTLIALFSLKIEKKSKIKHLSFFICLLITIIYSIRTINRNRDWQTPKTLALATIKTSPQSVRPYNDLAGYYMINENYQKAIDYYHQALEILPQSLTAKKNLGLIYLEKGLASGNKSVFSRENVSTLLDYGQEAYNQNEIELAAFYLGEAYKINPENFQIYKLLGQIYLNNKNYISARESLLKGSRLAPNQNQEFFLYQLGFISFQQRKFKQAKEYLNQVLEINPNNEQAQHNLEMIEKNLNKEI